MSREQEKREMMRRMERATSPPLFKKDKQKFNTCYEWIRDAFLSAKKNKKSKK